MSAADTEQMAEEIVSRVVQRLGGTDPQAMRVVAQEVASVLSTAAPGVGSESTSDQTAANSERIVITANGHNKAGIVARLAAAIDEFGGDIRDISQTIVGAYFTMIIVVDIGGATREGPRFGQLRLRLKQVGEDLGVHIVALHDDILASMHTI